MGGKNEPVEQKEHGGEQSNEGARGKRSHSTNGENSAPFGSRSFFFPKKQQNLTRAAPGEEAASQSLTGSRGFAY